jgi:two-component system copper resistance phosphate regulon response regulator CusR
VQVLLIEHDIGMVRVLERSLRAHGFEVSSAESDKDALALAQNEAVGIVVFDISPLSEARWALLQQLRAARPGLPMLALVGSEDCLPKPFALEELIGRIRAKTRGTDERQATTLVVGDLRLDLLARCGWYGEHLMDLPTREFALLEYFMRHPGRVLSRQAILADVWRYDEDPNSNVVDVYVRYLRNRLQAAGAESSIATVRGSGYRFDPPSGREPAHA